MSELEKYSDEELFAIFDADIENEIKSRGYEYGWHKKVQYAGEIYILINPAFPNLVKIGYADSVAKRVKTLNSNSGLPDPFHVYATYKVKKRLEDLKLHKLIDSLDSDLRHAKNKEFYEMSPEKAYGILSAIAEINGDEELLVLNPMKDGFFDEQEKTAVDGESTTKRKSPKGRLTFAMLGIPVGTQLVYADDSSITAITANDVSDVVYGGQTYTMSALVSKLKGGGSWQGSHYFLYEGKRLTKIRSEMEKED